MGRALSDSVFAPLAAGLVQDTKSPKADDRVVKVYPLDLTDPASAAELVRGMLSRGGRVVEDAPNRRIIVLDVPAVQARVAEALKTLRVPARNVRITAGAQVDNSWADLDVDLVNDQSQEVESVNIPVEYYNGVDSDGVYDVDAPALAPVAA